MCKYQHGNENIKPQANVNENVVKDDFVYYKRSSIDWRGHKTAAS